MVRPMNNIEKFQWDERDVLYGKGAHGNHHEGNKKWKKMISDRVSLYYHAPDKEEKKRISSVIVLEWRQQNGRFLAEDKDTKKWSDVGDDKATYKTAQRFRDEINRRRSKNLPPFDKSEHLDDFDIDLPEISNSSTETESARSESRKSWPGTMLHTQHNGFDLDMKSLIREWQQGEDGDRDESPALRPLSLEKRATSNQHDHEPKRPSLNRDNSATANRLKEQRNIQMSSNTWPGAYSSIQNPNGLCAEYNQYRISNHVGQPTRLSYRSSSVESLDLAQLSIPDLRRKTTNDWIRDLFEAEADANEVTAV